MSNIDELLEMLLSKSSYKGLQANCIEMDRFGCKWWRDMMNDSFVIRFYEVGTPKYIEVELTQLLFLTAPRSMRYADPRNIAVEILRNVLKYKPEWVKQLIQH